MDILNGLILLTISVFALGDITRIQLANNIAINILDLCVVFSAIVYLFIKVKSKSTPKSSLAKITIAFILIAIISLLINSYWLQAKQLVTSSLYLMRWAAYACVYFITRETPAKQKKMRVNMLLIAGSVVLLLGYIQLIFLPSLQPVYVLGWDKHLYRMVSTFLDPNFLGTFFVLYLFFVIAKIKSLSLQSKNSWVLLTIAFLTVIAIILTFSRTAIFCLVISGIIYLILINKKKLILGLFLILVTAFLSTLPFSHIENLNLLRVNSSKARLETWGNAYQIFQKNILFGVGFNTYRYAQIKYHLRQETTAFPSHADAGSDNSLLFLLATTGIIGFLIYAYLWGKLLEQAYKNKNKVYAQALIASAGGLFISCLFINSLFYPSIMLWMWMLGGFIDLE